MLTQQDMIDRLNQLMLEYNITWKDVKYDADKAIDKINGFMGTKYPKMSEKLTYPEATYTFRSDSVELPYFPEEYIHSVVIPFIAMEILARNEEFTTVYNKYGVELEDGLFTMFQKEFNRVPLAFRQDPDQGVFFAADSALSKVVHNSLTDLPVFKFRVYYHINNDVIEQDVPFVEDTRAYMYEDNYIVKGWNLEYLSVDGTKVFKFLGWARNINESVSNEYAPGTSHIINSDIHFYAVWEEAGTLTIDIQGVVNIKNEYKSKLKNLVIPDTLNGVMVKVIPTDFLKDTRLTPLHADNLESITMPKYLTTLQENALRDFKGHEVLFQETTVTDLYPGISIAANAFADTIGLNSIILTTNVLNIASGAFPHVDRNLVIYCRFLEENKPDGWQANWYAEALGIYTTTIVWGYNG